MIETKQNLKLVQIVLKDDQASLAREYHLKS